MRRLAPKVRVNSIRSIFDDLWVSSLEHRLESVPCGVEAFVMAKCVGQPCPLDMADQNALMPGSDTLNAAAWHYVVAMMLTGDRFANGAANDKSYHYRMFFDMLGIQQKQDDRIESKEEA